MAVFAAANTRRLRGTLQAVIGLPNRIAWTYLALTIAGAALYGGLWRAAPVIDGDSAQYMEVARDVADFRLDHLHYRSPGYPALIALTGSAETPTRALFFTSLLLHFASIWLLGLILHACGAGARQLTMFGVLLALPPYVEPAGYVMTENLAQFALVCGLAGLAMWFADRKTGWLALASVAFGLAALTRPAYQLLAVVLAAGLVLLPESLRRVGIVHRDAVTAGAALVTGAVLIVGGFCLYNRIALGYFGVVPSLGFHLSTKTSTLFERLPDEYSAVRDVLVRERNAELTRAGGRHDGTQTIWNAREELGRVTGLDTAGLSAYLVGMNLALIRIAPDKYLEDVARAGSSYWLPVAGPLATMQSSALRWVWALLHAAVTSTFFLQACVLIGLCAFAFSRRRRMPLEAGGTGIQATSIQTMSYLLGGAVVIYTMVLSCLLDIGEPRQRRPTDVIVLMMCFLAAQVWSQSVAERRQSPHRRR